MWHNGQKSIQDYRNNVGKITDFRAKGPFPPPKIFFGPPKNVRLTIQKMMYYWLNNDLSNYYKIGIYNYRKMVAKPVQQV